MPLTDDMEVESPQAVACDIPTHAELHALADKLSHAQHVLGIPELQKDFRVVSHPLFWSYMRAASAVQCAQPVPDISLAEAEREHRRAISDLNWYLHNSEDLRRQVESCARASKASRDFYAIQKRENTVERRQRRTNVVRLYPRRRVRSD
jgi:hypothetical protein